jgi:hypothetical protein
MEGIAPGINMRRLVEKCSPQTTELSVKHSTSVEKQNEMDVLLKKLCARMSEFITPFSSLFTII